GSVGVASPTLRRTHAGCMHGSGGADDGTTGARGDLRGPRVQGAQLRRGGEGADREAEAEAGASVTEVVREAERDRGDDQPHEERRMAGAELLERDAGQPD